jgi:hypothetical protein
MARDHDWSLVDLPDTYQWEFNLNMIVDLFLESEMDLEFFSIPYLNTHTVSIVPSPFF